MTTVKFESGQNGIYNAMGKQANGSFKAGLDGGLNPVELLEGAMALCVSLTLRAMFERDGVLTDDTSLIIDVNGEKDPEGANRFHKFDIKVKFPESFADEYKKKAMVVAERGCTIGNTIINSATVHISE